MKTSEVAAQAGVNTQTLRYYERRGLLPEPERSIEAAETQSGRLELPTAQLIRAALRASMA
ncbi:MAG: MerR family DNA-binding transcriptional regulator [Haloechinothrix sp.]